MIKKLKIIVLVLTAFFTTNNCSTNTKNTVIHPTESFQEEINSFNNSKAFSTNSEKQIEFIEEVRLQIGKESDLESDNYLYGVKNVVKGLNGDIYVSLPYENKIKVFSEDGSYKFSIGRSGRGPGEFMTLSKIEYNSTFNYLIALDRNEIDIFKIEKDTAIHIKSIFQDIESSTDLCTTKDAIYTNGFKIVANENEKESNYNNYFDFQASPPIHKYSLDSLKYEKSFGKNYEYSLGYGPFVGKLSKSLVSCSENRLVSIYENFPKIIGYDLDKNIEIWESGIKDLTVSKFKETKTPEPMLGKVSGSNEFTYNSLINVNGSNQALLQIGNKPNNTSTSKEQMSFLRDDFFVVPILINYDTGQLGILRKQKYVNYYFSKKEEIFSYPISRIDEGQVLNIKSNLDE